MHRAGILVLGLAALLMVRCGNEGGPTGSGPTASTGSAQGTITIDVGSTGGSASGTVTIVMSDTSVQVPISVEVQANGAITVDYAFSDVEPGLVSLFYVANLVVGGQTLVSSGYAPVQVTAGETSV